MNQSDQRSVALVTGGTAGVGLAIGKAFLDSDFSVVIVGRDPERLELASRQLQSTTRDGGPIVVPVRADVTRESDVERLFETVRGDLRRLDVLVNCVGASDRGLLEDLSVERLDELIRQNVVSSLLCCQASIDLLESSGGCIVNVGSLASKVGARYLGGYSAAKHALAGMTQQLRLELKPKGVHVALVSPGPIQRSDSGQRYGQLVGSELPEQASAPGAGTRVRGLAPERVATAVLRCVRRRSPDVMLPRHLRLLLAVGHAFPRLGDWLLLRLTSQR